MTLATGTKLGPYEIIAEIGKGGMGEVHRARDAKLGRDVAIKVLPEAFARDGERMARFQREAKVLASLNHPNIAAIYGFEDSGSTNALVMELVEGPTLADRINSGPIPLDEALRIAKQICEALEYAHERGVIHRDLKPANIKISRDDAVKILDFGLAKAVEGDASSMDMANSPTLTHMATQAGVLLGTAAYMSPEQAKAKPVDRRADIWAFGCVLYEMLTGKMAFHGETVSDTLAAIIKEEPDWSQLPTDTPLRVRVLLQRCLQKDPKQRLRDIGEARIALDEVLSGAQEPASVAAATMTRAPFWRRALPWGLLGATAIALAIVAWAPWRDGTRRTEAALMRFEVPLPKNAQVGIEASVFALSPDGRQLAFAASAPDGGSQIWVRPLDSLDAHPVAGAESSGIEGLFWSPDSRYIAFTSTQSGSGGSAELVKVPTSGGPAEKICDFTGNSSGGSWNPHGFIIFGGEGGVMRVSASGGSPQPLTVVRSGEEDAFPQILPDGRHFLYTRAEINTANVFVGSLDVPAAKQDSKPLLANSIDAVYVPSSEANGADPNQGQLLYVTISGGTRSSLMAQPFDARHLKLTGEAVSVAPGVAFSASANGVLAYRTTAGESGLQSLTWYDRQGKVLGTAGAPSATDSVSLSPDGKRAFIFSAKGVSRLWLVDFARNATTHFTFPSSPAGETAGDAVWSPDGSRAIFVADADGDFDTLYEKPLSGATDEHLVLKSPGVKHPRCWSPDGRFLLYEAYNLKTGRAEIWALPLGGDAKPVPVLRGAFNVGSPQLSPNGHWMAYGSDESGRPEIFVREFSSNAGETSFTLGGEWQVSTGGGVDARWGSDGKQLYYRGLDGKVMVVEVATKPTFQPGTPKELFHGPPLLYPAGADVPSGWGVSPDGKRFIFQASAGQSSQSEAPFTVVLNWQAALKQSQ